MDNETLIPVLALLLLLALIAVLWLIARSPQKLQRMKLEALEREGELKALLTEAEKNVAVWQERHRSTLDALERQNQSAEKIHEEHVQLTGLLERTRAGNEALQEKLDMQKGEMEEIRKKFTLEFENIAGRLLKQNSEVFTLANQKNIGEVLNPLKEKIYLFEKKVEDTYQKGLKDQTSLQAELRKLYDLNHRISEEAGNLTRALKGDVKVQGNWGEVVLERILERSGLNEGEQGYLKQYSDTAADGKRIQPDIVINLPDQKHIIIDSKVSLVAYERAVNAQTDEEREAFTKEHIASLKTHIRLLSEKHYSSAKTLNSPDFVLLFVPIEASFSLAVQKDQELFSYAWERSVVVVSPSTLLATLRTIASIWQQENQTRNALEIARQSGALYDKFVGLIGDLENIGKNLEITRKNYDQAMNKLHAGSGNLLRRVENIKKLGAKTTRSLPKNGLEE